MDRTVEEGKTFKNTGRLFSKILYRETSEFHESMVFYFLLSVITFVGVCICVMMGSAATSV